MYSEHLHPLRFAVSLLLALAVAVGCGRQGPPMPPPSRQPAPVQDLSVEQHGEEVRLELSYPTVTVGGVALSGVRAVEVWETVNLSVPLTPAEEELMDALPEAGAPPTEEPAIPPLPGEETLEGEAGDEEEEPFSVSPSESTLPTMSHPEFAATATRIAHLEGEVLRRAITGGRILIMLTRDRLGSPRQPEAAEEPKPETEEVHFFAVKTVSDEGKTSELSNVARLIPADPPPPPSGLAASAQESGVELTWRLPDGVELEGVVVYRRGVRESEFDAPLATVPAGVDRLLDGDVTFGRTYVYGTASIARRQPRVQSTLSGETSIQYEDVYPPAPPLRVAAFSGPGRVRLIWEASTSRDVTAYRVERSAPDGDFAPLTEEPVTGTEYIDADVLSGGRYVYRVLALDRAGNVSEPSAEEIVRVP